MATWQLYMYKKGTVVYSIAKCKIAFKQLYSVFSPGFFEGVGGTREMA